MNKTLVVTGGTGFIGRRLIETALQEGFAVRALVRDPTRLSAINNAQLRVFAWDLEGEAVPAEVIAGADAVCHFAAFRPPDQRDPSFAERCLRANALGTLHLLQVTLDAGVPHFVYCSAGNCYAPKEGLAVESDALYPSRHAPFYLSSKLTGEFFAAHFAEMLGLSVSILRVASVYGPGMGQQGLVPVFARRLRASEPITVQGGGRYTVDLVFVDDVVAATLRAAERTMQGAFNVGSGQLSSTLEIAFAMVAATGADENLIQVEPVARGAPSLGFVGLDVSRMVESLGVTPTPLADGIAAYLASL